MTTEVEVITVTSPSSCCVSETSCTAIAGSMWNPTTCSCLAYYQTDLYMPGKNWDAAYAACQSAAPTGFRGRLPFILDQSTYDVLHTLLPNGYVWIGLRTTGGSGHTANQLNFAEWSWYEGNDKITPLTFNPNPNGYHSLYSASENCIILNTGNSQYTDCPCSSAYKYFCEFVNGNK